MNQITGVHCIIELYGCPFGLLDDEDFIRETVSTAAAESGSTLLTLSSHQFSPQGVTALGLLAESHISVHTWPETGYAAADVFTCGHHCDPQQAGRYLADALRAEHHTISVLRRGGHPGSHRQMFTNTEAGDEACTRPNPHPPYG